MPIKELDGVEIDTLNANELRVVLINILTKFRHEKIVHDKLVQDFKILRDNYEAKLDTVERMKTQMNNQVNELWMKINELETVIKNKDKIITHFGTQKSDHTFSIDNLNNNTHVDFNPLKCRLMETNVKSICTQTHLEGTELVRVFSDLQNITRKKRRLIIPLQTDPK